MALRGMLLPRQKHPVNPFTKIFIFAGIYGNRLTRVGPSW